MSKEQTQAERLIAMLLGRSEPIKIEGVPRGWHRVKPKSKLPAAFRGKVRGVGLGK